MKRPSKTTVKKSLLSNIMRQHYSEKDLKDSLREQGLDELRGELTLILFFSGKEDGMDFDGVELSDTLWKIKSEKDLLDLYNGNF